MLASLNLDGIRGFLLSLYPWGWLWQEALQSCFHVESPAAKTSVTGSKRQTARITTEKEQKNGQSVWIQTEDAQPQLVHPV